MPEREPDYPAPAPAFSWNRSASSRRCAQQIGSAAEPEHRSVHASCFGRTSLWENVPYALQRINDVMNRNQLCVVPPKSSETEQKSPVSLHIIFGFSQARTATQSTPYPVPNEMPLEDQDELSLSPKQLAWPRYLLWRRPQW